MASTTGAEAGVPADLEKTTRIPSHSHVPPPELLANEADADLLGKQEHRFLKQITYTNLFKKQNLVISRSSAEISL
jgi:hypothetical protein